MEPITTGNIEKSIYWFTDFDWFLSLIYSLCLCNAPQKKGRRRDFEGWGGDDDGNVDPWDLTHGTT